MLDVVCQSVIAYLPCASPCPLLLWGVFTGRISLLKLFSMRWNLSLYGPIVRQNASRWSCWEAWGWTDGAARTRPNQLGCETKPTRVHSERCDSTRSQSMRGKMISAPTISPPPSSLHPLPKYLLLSIMFNYWQTQKQPSIVHARFCFAHPTGFILDSWNRRGFCCLSFIFMAYSKRSLLY